MSKRIEITIAEEGEVTIEAHGYAGKTCIAATKDYEDALGVVTNDVKKPEYNKVDNKQPQKVQR